MQPTHRSIPKTTHTPLYFFLVSLAHYGLYVLDIVNELGFQGFMLTRLFQLPHLFRHSVHLHLRTIIPQKTSLHLPL